MPLARIITHAVEQSQELAAELRGRGYDVEIVSPFETPNTRADVELHLEECTPEEALIRAGVLPETNDMSVFIAPGAIATRRQAEPSTPTTQMPRKWYQSSEEDGIELPFAVKPLEGDDDDAVRNAGTDEFVEDAAASEEHRAASRGFASEETASANSPVGPIGAKSAFHRTLNESAMDDLASARKSAAARASNWLGSRAPAPVRTLRIPVSKPRFFGWKAAAGVAVLAAVVLVMGAVRRKPSAPPAAVAPANDVQQTAPVNNVQAAPVVPPQSLPASATQGLTANAVGKARKARKATKASNDSVTPSENTPGPKTRPASEAKPKKTQPDDGIKRYSDLD